MSARSRWIVALTVVTAAAVFSPLPVYAGQEEQFTPEYKEVRSAFDAKHTPRTVAPERVKRGECFDVTITVGAGGDHPSLGEHFVRYIALYINGAEISRAYLHPVFSFPKVTFTIALDEGGVLKAVEEPTHSAAWESSKPIAVTPSAAEKGPSAAMSACAKRLYRSTASSTSTQL